MFYAAAAIFVAALYFVSRKSRDPRSLNHIPTVGPSQALLSYLGFIRFLHDASTMLQQGYERFKPGIFKVACFNGWGVVVCGAKYVEELRKATGDAVSFEEAAIDLAQAKYTLGKEITANPYHTNVLSAQLTRNLHVMFPDIHDEVVSVFKDFIPSTAEQEWVSIPALEVMMQVMTRVCNRIFVGLPVCREPDYVNLCRTFSVTEVAQAALVFNIIPKPLRPLAAFFLNPSSRIDKAAKILQPIIEERREGMKNGGVDRNDFLQWLLTDPKGSRASSRDLAARIMAVNIGAIRTPSMAMTHALFHLAARPEYIPPMRHEIESITRSEGWTKTSVDKMYKLDSFIKETMRVSDTRYLSMIRKATRQFSFSDGTIIPKGTMVFAASYPVHFDPSIYPDAHEFDGFRFEKLRERDSMDIDDSGPRYQLAAASTDYLAWGYGKHACPGRFFAALEMKLIIAHLILNYDVRLEQPGVRPPDFVFEANCMPNAQARVLLKRRK